MKAVFGVGLVSLMVAMASWASPPAPADTLTLLREFAAPVSLSSAALRTKGSIPAFIDFTPRGTQPDLVHALQNVESCAGCHSGGFDEPYYPYPGWSGSMMANAGRDPLFWAALDVANRDGAANGAEGIGDYCLRCHAPEAWYGGRVRKLRDVPDSGPVDAADVVAGFNGCKLQGRHDYSDFDNDYSGVTCHFCHRMEETGPLGAAAILENADVWLDDSDCNGRGEPCRAGPYRYPHTYEHAEFGPITYNGPPHAWKHSSFLGDSAMCGSCHDVTTPMLAAGPFRTLIRDNGTAQGDDTGLPFPIERTYSEWKHSEHARLVFRGGFESVDDGRLVRGETCQSCHMPQAEAPAEDPDREINACSVGGPPRNGDMRTHGFAGANTWIPGILKSEFPGLGRGEAFDLTTAAAHQMLSQHSATLESRAVRVPGPGAGSLAVSVRVINRTGHKLPTGYSEGRRMWLALQVRDAGGDVVWSNGDWNPATGTLDVDAQTRIYEIKQGIWDAGTGTCRTQDDQGRAMFHFVLNDCVAKDNRIPPIGFTGGDDPETASHGHVYPLLGTGAGVRAHYDDVQYAVPLPADVEFPLQVESTLRFQLASREYIEFLRDQAVEHSIPAENVMCAGEPGRPFNVGPQHRSRGQYMYDLWSDPKHGRSPPVDMASSTATVAP